MHSADLEKKIKGSQGFTFGAAARDPGAGALTADSEWLPATACVALCRLESEWSVSELPGRSVHVAGLRAGV